MSKAAEDTTVDEPEVIVETEDDLDGDLEELEAELDDEIEVELELDADAEEEQEEEKEYRSNAKAFNEAQVLLGDMSLPMLRDSDLELTAKTDPLTAYLARLNYIEPLPADEQQGLAERYIEEGDLNAARMLILTNLRLVVKLAREYQRRWTNLLDLIQEGNVGLAEAVTRYDPYRGVKFTSYAQYWIRAMILNYLMNHLHPVKIGSSRAGRKLFYNLKKARRALIRQGHHNPSPALIAEYLDVDEKEVVRVAAQLDAPPVFLDAQAPGHEKTTIGELMQSDSVTPEEVASTNEFNSKLGEVIAAFGDQIADDREKAIWTERMIAENAKSLVELGNDWGVSKERIRQVEVQIRKSFKKFLLEQMGDDVKIEFLQTFE
ncbi:MAG: sigma-70 family RNA polymerase sigma factor [Myxococcota bacterium]